MPPSNPAEQAQIQALAAQLSANAAATADPAAPQVEVLPKAVHEQVAEAIAEADEAIAQFVPASDGEAEGEEEASASAPVLVVDDDEDDPISKYITSARDKRGGIQEASTKAERILADANAERDRILAEAKRTVAEEIQKAWGLMASNPLEAATRFGTPVADVMRQTAEASDPLFQFKQLFLTELQKRDSLLEQQGARLARIDEAEAQRTKQAQYERFTRAQQEFIDIATEDDFPAVATFWGKKRLLAEAAEESSAIHDAAAALGARPEFTDRQIMERLERRARNELIAAKDKLVAVIAKLDGGKAPAAAAPAPKGKAAAAPPPAAKRPPPRQLTNGVAAASGVTRTSATPAIQSKTYTDDKKQLKDIASLLDTMKKKPKVA